MRPKASWKISPRSSIASLEKGTNKLKDLQMDMQVQLEEKEEDFIKLKLESKLEEMKKMIAQLDSTAGRSKNCAAKVKAYLKDVSQNKKAGNTKPF